MNASKWSGHSIDKIRLVRFRTVVDEPQRTCCSISPSLYQAQARGINALDDCVDHSRSLPAPSHFLHPLTCAACLTRTVSSEGEQYACVRKHTLRMDDVTTNQLWRIRLHLMRRDVTGGHSQSGVETGGHMALAATHDM